MQKMKIGLIQMGLKTSTDLEPAAIRDAMNEAHLPLIKQAAEQGVQVLCFQEVFNQCKMETYRIKQLRPTCYFTL